MDRLATCNGLTCLTMLLAGCASMHGDANAGPNLGGGFYGAPNLNAWDVSTTSRRFLHRLARCRAFEPYLDRQRLSDTE